MKFFRLSLSLLILGFIFQACSPKDKHVQLIPANALGVFTFNVPEIGKKVGWSFLSNSGSLKILNNNSDSSFNIRSTGIRLKSEIFSYGLPNELVKSGFVFYTLIVLEDMEKFEKFIEEKFEIDSIETFSSGKYVKIDDYSLLGWNKTLAILVLTEPEGYRSFQSPETAAVLTESLQKAFELPKENALIQNEKFKALYKSGYDCSYWFNYEAFANAMGTENRSSAAGFMASQKKLIRDSYLSGGFNFEKGKISGNSKFYFNPSSKGVLQSLLNPDHKQTLLSRIPGNKLNLMSSLHLNTGGITTLVDSMGMLPLVKLGIEEAGLDPEKVLNLLAGDFLLTVVDFNFKNFRFNFGDKEEEPDPFFQAALSFKVKYPATLSALLEEAAEMGMATAAEPGLYQLQNGYFLSYKENYVVLSLYKSTALQLVNNQTEKEWKLPKGVNQHAFNFYFDIHGSLQTVKEAFSPGEKISQAFDLLDDIRINSKAIQGDHLPVHYEINFQNKEENSLIQIIELSKALQSTEN